MTAEVLNILSSYGQSAVAQIQANTPKATGKTARSVRFQVTDEGNKIKFEILASKYFKVVETGRKPTPQYTKPSVSFVSAIRQWLDAKGKDTSLAYVIAKSIHQKGTKLFRDGGRKDVFSNVLNESFIDSISNDLLQQFAHETMMQLIKSFDDNSNQ